jgi:ATP-dependent RNA helicase RhlE
MKFENLNLIEPILRAVKTEGYTEPTPIQEQAIPVLLKGRDLIGCAQTGTGKTAAFAIPILQLLYGQPLPTTGKRQIKALVITPTRELAIQISESFTAYGKHTGLRHTVIYGGVSQNAQTTALRNGVDILVATPGRLLDLIDQRFVTLQGIQFFVLDEADRMLDMGFIHDVRKIIGRLPIKRQTLLFSATMPPEIKKLASTMLIDPVKIDIVPIVATSNLIKQSLYFVDKPDKKSLLIHLLQNDTIETALVFTRTKHGADKITKDLLRAGINAAAIHGNKSQVARQSALNNFKNKRTRVLVATDIASRGIDVEQLSHVINYEIPNIPETYIHRIGRTGRAGINGAALSFCDAEEKEYLKDIYKLLSKSIPIIEDHPFPMKGAGHSKPPLQSRPFNSNRNRPARSEYVGSSRARVAR